MKEVKKVEAEDVQVFGSDDEEDEEKSASEPDDEVEYVPEGPPHMYVDIILQTKSPVVSKARFRTISYTPVVSYKSVVCCQLLRYGSKKALVSRRSENTKRNMDRRGSLK